MGYHNGMNSSASPPVARFHPARRPCGLSFLLAALLFSALGALAPPSLADPASAEPDGPRVPGYEELYPRDVADAPAMTRERRQELLSRGIFSGFGPRVLSIRGKIKRFHKGIDVSAPPGSIITAFNDGTVVFSGRHGSYGISVIVRQLDGRLARYAHLSKTFVEFGDTLARGAYLGEIGRTGRATGVHLHFELIDEGRFLDPAAHVWLASELVLTPEDLAAKEREKAQLAVAFRFGREGE
jgi:murein DD-endopeptidase MepM/ murein hydrolase activator NlpD